MGHNLIEGNILKTHSPKIYKKIVETVQTRLEYLLMGM